MMTAQLTGQLLALASDVCTHATAQDRQFEDLCIVLNVTYACADMAFSAWTPAR